MNNHSNRGFWVGTTLALGAVGLFAVVLPNLHSRYPRTSRKNACINNLRQMDGAKEQWALEYKIPTNSVAPTNAVAQYIKGGYPACPQGGVYFLGRVGENPRCSVPGHSL